MHGQAVAAVDPAFNLFFLEGVSQDCCINGMAYGNGFATDVPYISQFNGGGGATFQQARSLSSQVHSACTLFMHALVLSSSS